MRADVVTLGIGGANHDFSAALAVNGEIVGAISEERLTRQKYSVDVDLMSRDFASTEELARQASDWTELLAARGQLDASVAYVLDAAGVDAARVDAVGYCCHPRVLPASVRAMPATRVNHHRAHGASSYLASAFDDAVVIVADGAGDRIPGTSMLEAVSVYRGRGQAMDLLWHLGDPHSLGGLYEAMTYLAGFRLLEEGKSMALASYGSTRFLDAVRSLAAPRDDGRVLLGGAPEAVRVPSRTSKVKQLLDACGLSEPVSREDATDLAAAVQRVLEDALLNVARAARRDTGAATLCLAGGVGLNSVANLRLLTEAGYDDLFVQPHAGDGGLAVGNALLAAQQVAPDVPRHPMRHAYLGRTYGPDEVRAALDVAEGVTWTEPDDVVAVAADLLANGAIIGWCQGGSEWGPRALGNRSILADPRGRDTKHRLDTEVKFREPFRPYAPVVLADRAAEWFEIDRPTPYMLLVVPVIEDKRDVIPAVVHVDGTARLQTVDDDANPRLAALLRAFEARTGVPVLLNTSFNVNKEPIVETPADAVRTLLASALDALVVGDFLVTRAGG
jgi:carbamoyltransferase